jgi:hypothetical protein
MARSKLALVRVLLGFILGLIAGKLDASLCWVSALIFAIIYIATIYAWPRGDILGRNDVVSAGIISSPAALMLGYFIGSVL